jgi:hypothetical protein
VKFCVVPESSARCTGVIAVLGSFTPALSAFSAGSSHVLILPLKIFAMVSADICRLVTPGRLNATAIGLT